jgi:hypothetical protein
MLGSNLAQVFDLRSTIGTVWSTRYMYIQSTGFCTLLVKELLWFIVGPMNQKN